MQSGQGRLAFGRQVRTPRWLVVATDLLLTLMEYDHLVVRRLPGGSDDPGAVIRVLLADVARKLPTGLDAIHQRHSTA